MGDVGELLKLSSCHQGSQLWWNDILFMPSQCIFILIAIAYLYQLCNSTDWFSFIEFDGIRGFDKYLHVYSIADIDMPIDMLVRTVTPTCHDIHHHTTDVWLLSGHPRVATGHAVSGQTRLCRRPWVLPWHILQYFSWQNPKLMVRFFLSQGGGGRDIPGTTGTGRGRHALVLSSAGRCCDRSAMSCVLVSILTHRLPCCLVEIEAPMLPRPW